MCDNSGPCGELDLLHGTEDDLELLRVQIAEHESLAKAVTQGGHCLATLLIERRLELFLLVPVSESFSADRCTGAAGLLLGLHLCEWHIEDVIVTLTIFGGFVGGVSGFVSSGGAVLTSTTLSISQHPSSISASQPLGKSRP